MIAFGVRRLCGRLFVFVAVAALAACATPRGPSSDGSPHYKVGAPYRIDGRWYYPKEDPAYEAVGVASWYGDAFQGKPTANGESFDKNRLSAAHKTLPLPSLVEVRNLENGRSVILRVNDRGPFVDDRLIDVSHAAAEALGFDRAGLARVKVAYIGRADLYAKAEPGRGGRPSPANAARLARSEVPAAAITTPSEDEMARLIDQALAAPPEMLPEIWIAVSDFTDLNRLEAARAALAAFGETRIVTTPVGPDDFQYQLQIGPEFDTAAAEARLAALREAGYAEARMVAG